MPDQFTQPLTGDPTARVLVAGASGFTGALAAQIVWRHPKLELVAATSRISSASALAAFALAPIVALALGNPPVALLALAVAVLVFIRHVENIRRLLAGTEPRIGSKA